MTVWALVDESTFESWQLIGLYTDELTAHSARKHYIAAVGYEPGGDSANCINIWPLPIILDPKMRFDMATVDESMIIMAVPMQGGA